MLIIGKRPGNLCWIIRTPATRRPMVFEALYSPYDQIIRTDKSAALGTGCAHFGNRTGQVVLGNLYNGTIHLEKSGTLGTGRGLTTKTSQCVIARATDFPFKTYTVKDKQVVIRETAYKIDLTDGNYTIRKLSATECERLQTCRDGYTEGVSNTQRYKMLGNGWTADVIAHIFSFIPQLKGE